MLSLNNDVSGEITTDAKDTNADHMQHVNLVTCTVCACVCLFAFCSSSVYDTMGSSQASTKGFFIYNNKPQRNDKNQTVWLKTQQRNLRSMQSGL